jgi:putative endonuclease
MRQYCVYILTNYNRTTLYIGVTNDLRRRLEEHRFGLEGCFTSRFRLKYLVYYEVGDDVREAIYREKQLKKWNRAWKVRLINEMNPEWRDLSGEIFG